MANQSGGNERFSDIDELCINTLRFLAVDAVEKANSGHPGMPMGDAAMAHVLWRRHLRFNPANPLWHGRDRFVLSAGHGSMLLYSLLHLTGYPLSLDDLKNFRQWGSPTAGHPEYEPALGIETTTGPLGQGFANGVGMAMAAKYLSDRYDRPGFKLFDYNIYAIVSDGDVMEGVANEAASVAGHLGLGQIIYLYSDNHITIEGSTDLSFTEDTAARFAAQGWHVQEAGGNDLEGLDAALRAAREETGRPSIIIARTHIGFGSPGKQDTSDVHGAPLGADEVRLTKEKLSWPLEPAFHVPDGVEAEYRAAADAGAGAEAGWNALFERYATEHPEAHAELVSILDRAKDTGWAGLIPTFDPAGGGVATRSASGKVINAIAPKAPFLVGGSADLGPSNNTSQKGLGEFSRTGSGPNIHFGVREHAMGSIMNGMALSGAIVPYGGTFLIFSEYMRPPIRLAALMGLHTVYVFTHDSIGLGEDGPTHQPIEQLASLRSIPNLTVLRPADANETAAAWRVALERKSGPVVLSLTRQKLPVLNLSGDAAYNNVSRGGYVLKEAEGAAPDIILIATGSEVHLALGAAAEIEAGGLGARVVSMPSWELFEEQDKDYRDSVLPVDVKARLAVEAGSTMGWHKYVGDGGAVLGIDRFGASAPAGVLFEKFGFTVENVKERALELVRSARA